MSAKIPHPLQLSGELSLRNIAELKATLGTALSEHSAVAIDADAVEGVDAGVLQLLVSAQKSAVAAGLEMSLSAPAAGPLGRALRAAGFFAADGRPLVAEAATWTLTGKAA